VSHGPKLCFAQFAGLSRNSGALHEQHAQVAIAALANARNCHQLSATLTPKCQHFDLFMLDALIDMPPVAAKVLDDF
jgi:hypothetical protein